MTVWTLHTFVRVRGAFVRVSGAVFNHVENKHFPIIYINEHILLICNMIDDNPNNDFVGRNNS